MPNVSEQLEKQLAALRAAYEQQLPGKLAEIETYWQELMAGWDPQQLKDLHRMCHSLTGSGATFGFDLVSRTARDMERRLKALLDQPLPPPAGTISEIQASLAALLGSYAPTPPADMAPPTSSPRTEAVVTDSVEDTRLLYLVDDDPQQAKELSLQLQHFGYHVRVFERHADLGVAIDQALPAVVIMDIMFPEGPLAGTDAAARLRGKFPQSLPFVFISSRDDMQARLEAVRAGSEAYFTKPVNIVMLVDVLDRLTVRQKPEPYRVLVVDDDKALAAHYSMLLKSAGMEAQVVNDPMAVMMPLSEFRPELIVVDMYMPHCTGLELAKVIRQDEDFVGIPIVFLSSEQNIGRQLEAMELGADDFLTKPIQPEHLVSSISSRVSRGRQLRALMMHDSLTGLLNHTATSEQLAAEVSRCHRQTRQLAYAVIDIDHFKQVNDTYGHTVGDRVIKSLARLLRRRLRNSDIIGRIGGEEFAVVLTDIDPQSAFSVMENVRESFQQIQHMADGGEFTVTLSCGIATFPACRDAAKLADAADHALYEVKRSTRNRVLLAG